MAFLCSGLASNAGFLLAAYTQNRGTPAYQRRSIAQQSRVFVLIVLFKHLQTPTFD